MFRKKKRGTTSSSSTAAASATASPRRPASASGSASSSSTFSGRVERISPTKASLSATAPAPQGTTRRWRPRRKSAGSAPPSSSNAIQNDDDFDGEAYLDDADADADADSDSDSAAVLGQSALDASFPIGVDADDWDALLPETPTFRSSAHGLDVLLDNALIRRSRAQDTAQAGDLAQSRLDHATMYAQINELPRTKALMYNKLIHVREERDLAVKRVHVLEGANTKLNMLLHIETEKVHKLQGSDKAQREQLRELRKHRREANILLKTTMADYEEHQRTAELEKRQLAEELLREAKAKEDRIKKELAETEARQLKEKELMQQAHLEELESHKDNHRNELSSRQSERDRAVQAELEKREREKRELEEKHQKEKEELEKHKVELEKKFLNKINLSKTTFNAKLSSFNAEKSALKTRLGKARKHLDVARDKHIVAREKKMRDEFEASLAALKAEHEKELYERDTFINKQIEYIAKIEEENRTLKIEKVKVSLMHLDEEYASVAAALGRPLN